MRKVLIVDDEPEILDLLKFELELMDFKVTLACSGNLAIEELKNKRFDLVISDMRMPDGSGYELVQWIAKNISSPPQIIILTGFSDIDIEELTELGVSKMLMKPIDFNLFAETVNLLCDG